MTPSTAIEDYLAAFLAEGWVEVPASGRARVFGAVEETRQSARIGKASIETSPAYDAYLEKMHATAERNWGETALALRRGTASAAVVIEPFGKVWRVTCMIAAPDLPEVDIALAEGARALQGLLSRVDLDPDLPDTIRPVAVWTRLLPGGPASGPVWGPESVMILYGLDAPEEAGQ